VGQNDPAALAAAVGQILSDDKLRRRITEKAYEKAAKIFSIKEMVNKYQNLLLSRNNMSQEGEFE
jgi:glycosyltransferase involved in cell wall biosynthesis